MFIYQLKKKGRKKKKRKNSYVPERIFFLRAIALQALLYHWHLSTHLQQQQQPDLQ